MIDSFRGQYRFLSSFWPCRVALNGEVYYSIEHAYQAAKTMNSDERAAIRKCEKPGAAKKLGRHVTLRSDWGQVKLKIMYELLKQKFRIGTELAKQLMATGTEDLIEGNTWGDTFWGVCGGEGQNNLGRLLILVRGELHVSET